MYRMTKKDLNRMADADILERAQSGCQDCKEEVINRYEGIVWKEVHKYKGRSASLAIEDLAQHGRMGILRAIKKFDRSRGVKFSTYATWWVRRYVSRSVPDTGYMIRRPVGVYEDYIKIQNAISQLSIELDRTPTTEEIADRVALTTKRVECVLNAPSCNRSLDYVLTEDGETSLVEIMGDTYSNYSQLELGIILSDMEEKLTPRERYSIREKFWHGKSLPEIGKHLRIAPETVRQAQISALRKLRSYMTNDTLSNEDENDMLECILK